MEKINVGIVGSQFAAMLHAESYKRCPLAKIQSVASMDTAIEFADSFNIPKRYTDYREMFIKEDLDLVSVCVPNFLHKEIVLAAVAANIKAIVCEKPLATSLEDGAEMIQCCKKNGVNLMYAEDWIFAPALVRAKKIYKEGGIGDLLYIKAKETHSGSHSIYAQRKEYCGGGSMIHLAIHPIGFIPWFTGEKIIEVVGMTSGGDKKNLLHHNYTGEDWGAALFSLEKNTKALVEGNYITCGGMDDIIEIYGSEGNIHINLTKGSPLTVYSRPGYGYAIEKADFTHGWTQPAVDELESLGYINELAHFVDCVHNKRESQNGTTGKDGLKALAVIFAIYESAAQGKKIKVQEISLH